MLPSRRLHCNVYDRQGQFAMNRAGLYGRDIDSANAEAGLYGRGAGLEMNRAGFMGNIFDTQMQDYVARMNQAKQAQLAQAGMDMQGQMAEYNKPTGFDQALSAVNTAANVYSGFNPAGGVTINT